MRLEPLLVSERVIALETIAGLPRAVAISVTSRITSEGLFHRACGSLAGCRIDPEPGGVL